MPHPRYPAASVATLGAASAIALAMSLAMSLATPAHADPLPACNDGTPSESTECGTGAEVTGNGGTAVGHDALAGEEAVALGNSTEAEGLRAIAIGAGLMNYSGASPSFDPARASGTDAIAAGTSSLAGIAAAMAQAEPPFPSAAGRTSYAGRGAVYRGEYAFSLGFAHRLDTASPFALSASVSHAGARHTGASVGFAGEF